MPKWGLDEAQIDSNPWGIPAEWLKPLKTVTDPVHGDIYINTLEGRFLDSPPLQRLRRVRQLGTSHLVYPGATHSRFSHAIGAIRAAQNLLDAVVDNRNGPRAHAPDFFTVWTPDEWSRKLAEVTVLARLGALLHDMAHVPYGHTVEDDLKILTSHDHNEERFATLWSQLPDDLREMLDGTEETFRLDLLRLILSKDAEGDAYTTGDMRYPFVADIVGNTICADLLDYLVRDHLFTGLPVAFGDRFADDFFVSSDADVFFPGRMVVRITRDGHDRADIVTELLKYLRYRYELSERVLTHHAKLAADAMIGKLLEMWRDETFVEFAQDRFPNLVRRHRRDIDALREAVRRTNPAAEKRLNDRVQRRLEEQFLRSGDDGLLEWIRDWAEGARRTDGRRAAVGNLATDVLNRHLFKPIGRAHGEYERGLAEELHERFGSPERRRSLEEAAATFAGMKERWQVVIWLPAPKMRLKVAEVLVERDGQISPLDKVGNKRAEEIYASHKDLWAISVFAHSTVADDSQQVEALLAFLGREMGIRFHTRDGQRVRSVLDIAIDRVIDDSGLADNVVELRRVAHEFAADNGDNLLAAHTDGSDVTMADLQIRVREIGVEHGILRE